MRKVLAFTAAALAASAVAVGGATTPAQAMGNECDWQHMWTCGDVYNKLNGHTVKVGQIKGNGKVDCNTWNYGPAKCDDFWLPNGKSTWDIPLNGDGHDVDTFMVEDSDYVVHEDGSNRVTTVSAGQWTRLYSFEEVNCEGSRDGKPYCFMSAG